MDPYYSRSKVAPIPSMGSVAMGGPISPAPRLCIFDTVLACVVSYIKEVYIFIQVCTISKLV